jgi:hypothetical protein
MRRVATATTSTTTINTAILSRSVTKLSSVEKKV